MNKILVDNTITCDNDEIKIDGNVITFLKDGEYELTYLRDGDYKLEFIVNGNVFLLEESFNKKINTDNRYVINGGKLVINKFYNNLAVVEKVDIDLCNIGSEIDYKFSSICRVDELYTVNVNHLGKDTISNISNKAVALDNSKINFIVNSNVNKKAIGSNLNQNTRIVTMGDADTSIKPNMYIPIDDVIAKHGSIVGTFKDDDIFYIMSKGINYNDTLKLMVKGYILSNIDPVSEIRKKIMDVIETYWR